jgi:hypothetical protein
MKEKLAFQGRIASLLKNQSFVDVKREMELLNDGQLAEFLVAHPQLHEPLRSPELNEFWDERRKALRLPGKVDFRFMAQPGIKDADQVIGYLLFLLQLHVQKAKKEESVSALGVKPTDYLSIHCIRRHLHQIYLRLGKATEDDLISIAEFLYNLEAFAKLHQCPGFLLMANGYMQLALRYQQLMREEECNAAFKLCWKFLHLAELSEHDSEESINNAYFGRGLVLSTPFNLDSIHEMKSHCLKAANTCLSREETIGAEQAALSMYQHAKILREPVEVSRISLNS